MYPTPSSCLTPRSPPLPTPCLWASAPSCSGLSPVRSVFSIVATRGSSSSEFVKPLHVRNLVRPFWPEQMFQSLLLYELYLEIPSSFYKGKDFRNLKLCRMEKGRNWGCFVLFLLVYLLPSNLNVISFIYICMYVYTYICWSIAPFAFIFIRIVL